VIDSPSGEIVAHPIDLGPVEPRVREQLIDWYAEIEAVAREINDRVSLLRATDRLEQLRAVGP
jgi:hypothetical protein